MSCFFFDFKPMGLYSGGLIHGLMFTLVTWVAYMGMGLFIRGSLQYYIKQFLMLRVLTGKKTPSNNTPTLLKSMNMDIWVVGT